MIEKDRVLVVQGQLEAYNRRDVDAFCQFFHPQVVVTNLGNNQQLCHGLDAFRQIYEKMFADSPQLHCELLNRIVLPETVIDHERVTGRASSPDVLLACAIYGFRDGLIDRVWFTR